MAQVAVWFKTNIIEPTKNDGIMTKFYSIYAFIGGEWREYNGIEYTEKEADKELRYLKKYSRCKFRKKCIRQCKTVELSVRC